MKLVTPEFARTMEQGRVYRLAYNCHNLGVFYWRHDSICGDIKSPTMFSEFRLKGEYAYATPNNFSDKGDYLYEFEGVMCRGSGAEPCFLLEDSEELKDVPHWDDYCNSHKEK